DLVQQGVQALAQLLGLTLEQRGSPARIHVAEHRHLVLDPLPRCPLAHSRSLSSLGMLVILFILLLGAPPPHPPRAASPRAPRPPGWIRRCRRRTPPRRWSPGRDRRSPPAPSDPAHPRCG